VKTYRIPHADLEVTRIAYGCMKIGGRWDRDPITGDERARAERAVMAAVEQGITLFDHADIYCMGKSEEVFGDILRATPGLRDRILIQSKCGIRFANDPNPGDPHRFDFSYQHIVHSVEGSLKRLQTDRLDILLLHRPDALVEPEEVARAFDDLHRAGKVRFFGVSNHTPWQIALLQKHVAQPLIANQVELSLLHADLIDDGIVANQQPHGYTASAGTLDYCREQGILVQAWGPVAGGRLFDPQRQQDERAQQTAALVAKLAQARGTTPEAIALAWLLRHPAGIQPIIGTVEPARMAAFCAADALTLSREEWYELFVTARGAPLP
jgi:predicted oxidoreductase